MSNVTVMPHRKQGETEDDYTQRVKKLNEVDLSRWVLRVATAAFLAILCGTVLGIVAAFAWSTVSWFWSWLG